MNTWRQLIQEGEIMSDIVRRALRAAELAEQAKALAEQKEEEVLDLISRMTEDEAVEYVTAATERGL